MRAVSSDRPGVQPSDVRRRRNSAAKSSSIGARSSTSGRSISRRPTARSRTSSAIGFGMVVDPQVDPAVVACRHSRRVGPDDQQRRRLPATPVAAGLVTRRQRRDEPVRQRTRRREIRRQHRVDDLRAGQDVALDRDACLRSGRRPSRGRPRPLCVAAPPARPRCRPDGWPVRVGRDECRRGFLGAAMPAARRPRPSGPYATLADAWVATAPTPAVRRRHDRPRRRGTSTRRRHPRSPVEASRATIEKVIGRSGQPRARIEQDDRDVRDEVDDDDAEASRRGPSPSASAGPPRSPS